MWNHMLLSVFLELFVVSYSETGIPGGEYCAKVYGPYVSKVLSSPSGTVSLYFASQTTTISISDVAYRLDESTGLIKMDIEALRYGARRFPFIAHLWNMRYDSIKNEVQVFSSAAAESIAFEARCKFGTHPLRAPRPEGLIHKPLPHKQFCISPRHGMYGRFTFMGYAGFNAEFRLNSTTISLYHVKYRTKGPNIRGIRKIRYEIPEHLPELSEFPHLGYYFRLRYNITAETMFIFGPPFGSRMEMTSEHCRLHSI
ncbi:hypothetical protein FOL47_003440 [Perkinsus chesapeaki]|uniref:Uncharacterized protein n=1 Tax=Perkinsus chesapeaki TaxID=330153 RepID=A0A7J6M874_PERCH|nr:hypothetical protein FOL47_003440 [Perkinsus chesapeaki]